MSHGDAPETPFLERPSPTGQFLTNISQSSRSLQLMSRLLLGLLPRRGRLTVLDILLHARPRLSHGSQLSRKYEIRTELHHTVCCRDLVSQQELAPALLQFRRQVIEIFLDVDAGALLRLCFVTVLLEPTTV